MSPVMLRTSALFLVLLLASAGLAGLWFDREGQIRNIRWAKPEPMAVTVPDIKLTEPAGVGPGNEFFEEILSRPLFAADRLPPPPPAAVVVDALTDARILGLIAGAKGSVLMRAEGKVRMLAVNDKLGSWTLAAIEERAARFERDGEKRTLNLEYTPLGNAPTASVGGMSATGPSVTKIGDYVIPQNLPPADRAELEARIRARIELQERYRNKK